jgi:HK97 family phage major capsid protein
MVAQAHKLFEDVKAILTNPKATAEDRAKIDGMLAEAKDLQKRAAQLKEVETAAIAAEIETKDDKRAGAGNPPNGFKTFGQYLYHVARAGNVLTLREAVHPALIPLAQKAAQINSEGPAVGGPHTGDSGWLQTKEKKDLAENVGATGGFLVPVEQLTDLFGVTPPPNSVRAKATIIPMRRRQISVPVIDQTGTTTGRPHWFGGIIANWTEEATQKQKTEPAFRQLLLTAHELVCYCVASDVLLDDEAVGLAAFLAGPMGFKGAIDWYEEYAFLMGTGAGQPLGVVNAGATLGVNGATQFGFTLADSLNMLESLLPGANAMWHFNQRHLSAVYGMTDAVGNLCFVPNVNDQAPGKLWGFPVQFTEKLPAPGTTGSAILADWKYYYVGDRKGTTIDSTNLELFRYNQTSWRAVHRVDGQPAMSTPLTLQDGATQVSPFVMLAAKTT